MATLAGDRLAPWAGPARAVPGVQSLVPHVSVDREATRTKSPGGATSEWATQGLGVPPGQW